MSDQYTRQILQAVTGKTVRYRIIPAMSGVPAAGVSVVSGAGAWGAYANLAAANAITTEFYITGFDVTTLGGGAIQVMEIEVADATPAVLTQFHFDPSLVTLNSGPIPVGPYPIWMPANSQVQYRAGGAAARSIAVFMRYAILL